MIFLRAFELTGGFGLNGFVLSLKDRFLEQFVKWAGRRFGGMHLCIRYLKLFTRHAFLLDLCLFFSLSFGLLYYSEVMKAIRRFLQVTDNIFLPVNLTSWLSVLLSG